jgi:hypothetical protein
MAYPIINKSIFFAMWLLDHDKYEFCSFLYYDYFLHLWFSKVWDDENTFQNQIVCVSLNCLTRS